MNALVPIQTTTAVAAQGSRRDGIVRVGAAAAPPPWRGSFAERQTAWNVWRATQPAPGYVVHQMNEIQGERGDASLLLRGQAAYAAQAARAMSIEGPAGTVSLLV